MQEDQLRDLQKKWYKILADSGFEDIEEFRGGELVLKQSCVKNLWQKDSFDFEMNQDYFMHLSHIVNDENTVFRNFIDRIILQMYVEGDKIKDIVHKLSKTGIPFLRRKFRRNRASVRFIIRRYEVKWNIRTYSPRELNQK